MEMTKERHGFVTFWLWLCIIACAISAPVSMFRMDDMKTRACDNLSWLVEQGLIEINHDVISSIESGFFYLYIVMALEALFMIVGYAKLLKWKKSGFWFLIGTRVLSIATCAALYVYINKTYQVSYLTTSVFQFHIPVMVIASIVGAIYSLGILLAILQIRKNGVSCWKQLE